MTGDRERQWKPTVCVDFDGVCHSYTSKWTTATEIPDPPVDGAIEWLESLAGPFQVVILSTRGATADGAEAVRRWLDRYGYTGPRLDVTNVKPPAILYVDDRGFHFTGPGSFPSAEEIKAFRPWNKP